MKKKGILLVTGDFVDITDKSYESCVKHLRNNNKSLMAIDGRDPGMKKFQGDQSYISPKAIAMLVGDVGKFFPGGAMGAVDIFNPATDRLFEPDDKKDFAEENPGKPDDIDPIVENTNDDPPPDADTEDEEDEKSDEPEDNKKESLVDIDGKDPGKKKFQLGALSEQQIHDHVKEIMGKDITHVTRPDLLKELELKDTKQKKFELVVLLLEKHLG